MGGLMTHNVRRHDGTQPGHTHSVASEHIRSNTWNTKAISVPLSRKPIAGAIVKSGVRDLSGDPVVLIVDKHSIAERNIVSDLNRPGYRGD